MELKVNARLQSSKQQNKQLRKQGNVPAIIYGKHLKSPIQISCFKNDFIKVFKDSGYSTPITVKGDGVNELVLIQDMQLDPVTNIILHIDLLAVSKDEKVKTEVTIVLIGESSIEKLGLGKIQLIKDFVEVEAFPQDLPHDIQIDISKIEKVGDTVFIKDIEISNKVKILDDMEQPIVTVVSLDEEVEEQPVVETTTATTATDTKTENTKESEKK